jgi:hypothetical protein
VLQRAQYGPELLDALEKTQQPRLTCTGRVATFSDAMARSQ